MTDKVISTGWHHQYGWLRRPELDDANGYCYEEPDGGLVYTPHARHRRKVRLACRFDEDAQENYLSISYVPCSVPRPTK